MEQFFECYIFYHDIFCNVRKIVYALIRCEKFIVVMLVALFVVLYISWLLRVIGLFELLDTL